MARLLAHVIGLLYCFWCMDTIGLASGRASSL